MYSTIQLQIVATHTHEYPLFNGLITKKITNRIAIAVSDASIKDGYMLGY